MSAAEKSIFADLTPEQVDAAAEEIRRSWLWVHLGADSTPRHPPWRELSEERKAKWRLGAMAAYRVLVDAARAECRAAAEVPS